VLDPEFRQLYESEAANDMCGASLPQHVFLQCWRDVVRAGLEFDLAAGLSKD